MEIFNEFLREILDTFQSIEFLLIIGLVITTPYVIYMAFDSFCKRTAEKVYTRIEEYKRQKEYDEMMTRHEERYFNK